MPESEETRATDAEVEAARCPDTTAKVLSPLARAMVEEAQAMKAHADYCFPDTGGVATIRRAIFLSRGGHKSGEVCHYQEWTGERILHAAGCAYFGIQDDTVPCQCPIVRANAAAAFRQPREGAEAYEPCEPCKRDDHDNCTGDCPSMCCALATTEAALADANAEIERMKAACHHGSQALEGEGLLRCELCGAVEHDPFWRNPA